jgi:uncharacterized membrane protein HdeD (DUF308 family)
MKCWVFIGTFWLASGIVSLRWGTIGERARGWPLLAGVIGVLAGFGILSRVRTTKVSGCCVQPPMAPR